MDEEEKSESRAAIENMEPEDNAGGQMRESIRVVKKAPALTGKRKVRFVGTSGYDYSVGLKKYVYKSEHIDKDKDERVETIIDPDTGETITHVDHSLRKDHQGHGSAKLKKK